MNKFLYSLLGLVILAGGYIYFNRVQLKVTPEDEIYIHMVLKHYPRKPVHNHKDLTFDEQINSINIIQRAFKQAVPDAGLQPEVGLASFKQLYETKHGECYDRSFAIEQMLTYHGFNTRHIAIYSTRKYPWWKTLLIPNTDSHALLEVETKKGWMVVDSNGIWTSLTTANKPIAARNLLPNFEQFEFVSTEDLDHALYSLFAGPHLIVYGMYSRHGYFHKPYLPFPDIIWGQFIQNFI